jgi:pimeloyl-ACP methyl ester carboxylesterase
MRWLGPWADPQAVPRRVRRARWSLDGDDSPVEGYRYEPLQGGVHGVYLIVPGLHYAGPDDPRLDRFCRVLADGGYLVVCPFLRDYLKLEVAERASGDAERAFELAHELAGQHGLPLPAVFSISFGSTPALALASSDVCRGRVGALLLFGGYHDFYATIRFAVTRRAYHRGKALDVPHDPLNVPAVFINLLQFIDDAPGPHGALKAAWLRMAERTWGRPDLRPRRIRLPIAERLASELPERQRELFMVGCGLAPGAEAVLESALGRSHEHFAFTDPRDALTRLSAPLVLVHGRDDDVIPFAESEKLADALPPGHPHRLLLTGMYGHTGAALPSAAELKNELESMLQAVYAMVDAPLGLL